jgi:hypothetical protein
MEERGDKKSSRICSDISPPFFYIVLKLVQALLITYDEIFQALAIAGILQSKPFMDLGVDGAFRWKFPASEVAFEFSKRVEIRRARSRLYSGGHDPEIASGARHLLLPPGLVSLIVYDKWKLCERIEV